MCFSLKIVKLLVSHRSNWLLDLAWFMDASFAFHLLHKLPNFNMTFQTTERNEDNSMGKHHMVPSVVNDEIKNIQQIIDSQAERLWEINQKVPPKCKISCGQHERATF